MKHNKTYKRNKNTNKFNLKCGKTKKGKTKKGKTKKGKTSNKTTGGDMPKVVVKSRFTKKNANVEGDVNRFDINITSHYDQKYLLYEAEEFLRSFRNDYLNPIHDNEDNEDKNNNINTTFTIKKKQ